MNRACIVVHGRLGLRGVSARTAGLFCHEFPNAGSIQLADVPWHRAGTLAVVWRQSKGILVSWTAIGPGLLMRAPDLLRASFGCGHLALAYWDGGRRGGREEEMG